MFVRYLIIILVYSSLLISCKKDTEVNPNIIPSTFFIDINSALSFQDPLATIPALTKPGNEYYKDIRRIIFKAEGSAKLVNDIIYSLRIHNIHHSTTFSHSSKEDGRRKDIEVRENIYVENKTWPYELTLRDEDGSTALQFYWSNSPLRGILFFNPYNYNRSNNDAPSIMYRIDYSEKHSIYDKIMEVAISGIPVMSSDTFGISSLKMFVGKKGEALEVYGNSNHPNFRLSSHSRHIGRNYAFVAKGNVTSNIAVAKIGLPPSNHSSNSNIMTDHPLYTVLHNELVTAGISDPNEREKILTDAKSPGFYTSDGFIKVESPPVNSIGFDEAFISLSNLNPYIPVDITNLTIKFK